MYLWKAAKSSRRQAGSFFNGYLRGGHRSQGGKEAGEALWESRTRDGWIGWVMGIVLAVSVLQEIICGRDQW